jgi:hypothetical protein
MRLDPTPYGPRRRRRKQIPLKTASSIPRKHARPGKRGRGGQLFACNSAPDEVVPTLLSRKYGEFPYIQPEGMAGEEPKVGKERMTFDIRMKSTI